MSSLPSSVGTREGEAASHASKQQQHKIDTVIVGGGQSGLSISCCLMDRGVPHVVLERGSIVERWRSERWDSLRLLTPNWMTRLPGNYCYRGDDVDGFMTVAETIAFFEEYAASFSAPVWTETEVVSVERMKDGSLHVGTNQGTFIARNLVIATGFCDQTRLPSFAKNLSPEITQVVPGNYRRPSQLPPGNVLVVGASATGCQIAEELLNYREEDGRTRFPKITISVGKHTRVPRLYRGRDILHWLYAIGFFSSPCDAGKERDAPAPQIIGTPEKRDLDLGILQTRGVDLVGRLRGMEENNVLVFDDDLKDHLSAADAKLNMLLTKIDDYIVEQGIDAPPASPVIPVPCPSSVATEMALQDAGIRTVIWATGYERQYPWLQKMPSILDANGDIRHKRGVTPEGGVYVLGMRFQMTRISNFIDGVGADAEELADKIVERKTLQ